MKEMTNKELRENIQVYKEELVKRINDEIKKLNQMLEDFNLVVDDVSLIKKDSYYDMKMEKENRGFVTNLNLDDGVIDIELIGYLK